MPNPSAFFKSFDIRGVAREHGWKTTVTHMEHTPVVQYQSYKYIFEVVFLPGKNASSSAALIKAIRGKKSIEHIVTTRYGNPYLCEMTSITAKTGQDGKLYMTIKGKARRI